MLENLAGAGSAGEGTTRRIVVVGDDPVLRAIYGESESGALTVVGGVGMDLRERLEQLVERRLVDADTVVDDLETQSCIVPAHPPDTDRDLPSRRELHRVADQVEQYLLDLAGIADPVRIARRHTVQGQRTRDSMVRGRTMARTPSSISDNAKGACSTSMRPASMRL